MNRRRMLVLLGAGGVGIMIAATRRPRARRTDPIQEIRIMSTTASGLLKPLPETEAEWKKILTPQQYRILRRKGTERAFTGEYWNSKKHGVYRCAGCGQTLFSSEHKFDSGTGWPSFWRPVDASHVAQHDDNSFFMRRTEVLCSRCNGHLGHVFNDGPRPTGLRYCINSVSLKLNQQD